MTDVYLVEPGLSAMWYPFADSRPVAELRAGAWLIRERWEAIAEGETQAIFGPSHLYGFVEQGVPPIRGRSSVDGPAIVGRADFAPSGVKPSLSDTPARLVNEQVTVGWWVPAGTPWEGEHENWEEIELEGFLLMGAFDLVTALEHFLVADMVDFTHEPSDPLPDGSMVIGDPAEVIMLGAVVEPGVTFDVRGGAVVVEEHAYVRGGTRLEGPVYIGAGTEILGGPVSHCSIGPRCKVRGEIAHSVLFGFANKSHDGFVGHTVLGRWVNLGAGTVTSNLKNTYGPVRLEVAGERIETGRQFLGALVGDHAKTAIGTLLNTGTVIGVGANVFGATPPPKYVPPFVWGVDGGRMDRDGFLTVAARMMPRRQIEVTDAVRAALGAIYDHAVAS